MKILHVVTGLQAASGVTVFVNEVTKELRKLGHEVIVAIPNGSSINWNDKYDIVHINGLWSLWLHKIAKQARRSEVPIVWSPHGMLQKWALKNKWHKKIVGLLLYQWRDLNNTYALHATASSEVEDIKRLRLHERIIVAPLGVRMPIAIDCAKSEQRILLFVSRVQRKKGLPNLIEAWSKLPQSIRGEWHVRVVGPDEDGHIAELKEQCMKLGVSNAFTFVGPKYEQELDEEYFRADAFVFPTHSENFGSVVVEALAHGLPVLTTKEAPWEELEKFNCGWWIDDNVTALTNMLKQVLQLDQMQLAKMGENGRKFVADRYQWSAVVKKLVQGYEMAKMKCEKGYCADCPELYDTCSP